jgi:hypothetical protein
MLNEQHHITFTLHVAEDFHDLVRFIDGRGLRMPNIHHGDLTVECYVDDFILSIIEKYLSPGVVHHSRRTHASDVIVFSTLWEHKPTG